MPLRDAPDLWANLSLDDIAGFIKGSACELKRLYSLQAADDQLPPQRRDITLRAAITAYESAHDEHLRWYQVAARKTGQDRSVPLG